MEKQLEQLTALVARQAEMAQSAHEEAKKREERLTSMLEGLVTARIAEGNSNSNVEEVYSAHEAERGIRDPRSQHRIPPGATPAPYLSSSVSLKEFDAWRHKLEGYVMLTGISSLTPAEQRSALISLVDDE